MATDPQTLLKQAQCFSCFASNPYTENLMEFGLLLQIAKNSALPSAPTNADITDASLANNIVITWTASTGATPDNYQVWRSKNGGAFVLAFTVAGTVTTVTDPGPLGVGDIWTYEVLALKSGVSTAFSNTVSISNLLGPAAGAQSFPDLVREANTITPQVGITSLSMPKLRTIRVNLNLNGDNLLTTLTITSLKTVGGFIDMTNCNALTAFNAPALVSTGNDLVILNGNALTSFSAPVLATVGGQIEAAVCPSLTSLSFPSLISVAGDFDAFHDATLTSITLPVLTSFGGRILCGTAGDGTASAVLATFSASSSIYTTPGVLMDWNGCALGSASVNKILSRGVATGVGLTTANFELNAAGNAAPVGQGLVDKATLQGQGNTVITN
jgi:hypothetical protein